MKLANVISTVEVGNRLRKTHILNLVYSFPNPILLLRVYAPKDQIRSCANQCSQSPNGGGVGYASVEGYCYLRRMWWSAHD